MVDRTADDAKIEALLQDRLFTADELVVIVADGFGMTIKPKMIYDMTYLKANPIRPRPGPR